MSHFLSQQFAKIGLISQNRGMKHPNLNEEKKLWRKGYERVVGLDEAGRGPLAGPVIAAAAIIEKPALKKSRALLKKVRDSKKLSSKKREEIYQALKEIPEIEWGIGRVSEKVIDKINILEATKLAMKRAVKNLEKKYSAASFLILDGNFEINLDIPQKSVIAGDEKVLSCSLASIIAKVNRDRTMINYHKKYPQYVFSRHKGYSTKLHRDMIKRHGFCRIHRRSFTV